jgi:hypothetical protein
MYRPKNIDNKQMLEQIDKLRNWLYEKDRELYKHRKLFNSYKKEYKDIEVPTLSQQKDIPKDILNIVNEEFDSLLLD